MKKKCYEDNRIMISLMEDREYLHILKGRVIIKMKKNQIKVDILKTLSQTSSSF